MGGSDATVWRTCFTLSQTDRFVVPPAITGAEYPNQWHLTARVDGCSATRFLAIIR